MSGEKKADDRFRKGFLIALAVGISLIFFAMIQGFLKAVLIAAITSAIVYPIYRRLRRLFRGRAGLASGVTIVIVFFLILGPLLGFLGIVASQAVQVSEAARPSIERLLSQPNQLDRLLERVPLIQRVEPYKDFLIDRAGQLANRMGNFIIESLTAATRGTVIFFFHLFIMLYAMYFFLIDGRSALEKLLYYLPLSSEDEQRMLDKFVSVTRATLKGTLVIGVVQGGLAGAAFAVAGIKGPVFWGTVMAVLSIIPGVGTALIWVPAVGYLFAVGHIFAAIALAIWCAAIVGTADNFLRPWLIGKDTKMPDLLILLGTLGGIVLFGAIGIIIGPIIAALFLTVWDIYGVAFKDYLPAAQLAGGESKNPPKPPASND